MNASEVIAKLAEPFPASQMKFKPQTISKNREGDGWSGLAVPYLDARAVMDRLDAVVGAGKWFDEYQLIGSDSVKCSLHIFLPEANGGGQWVKKEDVGSKSDQPDEGDQMKSAFSDALKRAAVKFGVGRYIYSLPKIWVPCEVYNKGGKDHFKKWKKEPTLPDSKNKGQQPSQNGKQESKPDKPPFERACEAIKSAKDVKYLNACWAKAKERKFSDDQMAALKKLANERFKALKPA